MCQFPQVFLDALQHGFYNIEDVNLIVMDECHHCSKKHPYAQIMDYVHRSQLKDKPRFLGLTASVVTEKVSREKFVKLKEEVEERTKAKVITTENLDEFLK